ncbi:MAG: hypothetical protein ABL984_02940, partial [Pyrinomonadaceae bacterium]
MRKKLVASLSILAVLAFAIAAFAYTQNTNTLADKPSCCKSKDSCPMKSKHEGHDANGEHAKMDCCKKHDGDHAKAEGKSCCGDSCPMKKKGEGANATTAATDGKSCCCDCCGDSCPMKKKGDGAAATAPASGAEGEGCCCDCCKG